MYTRHLPTVWFAAEAKLGNEDSQRRGKKEMIMVITFGFIEWMNAGESDGRRETAEGRILGRKTSRCIRSVRAQDK
jgi:hypothetical protein